MSAIRLGLVFGFIFQTTHSLADKLSEQVDQKSAKSLMNLSAAVANNAVASSASKAALISPIPMNKNALKNSHLLNSEHTRP